VAERTCPSADELSAFILGTLPPPVMEAVGRHLDSCSACEAAVQSLEHLSDPVIAGLRRRPGDSLSSTGHRKTKSAAVALPEHLGDYRIIREVGRGGMGVVYEAEQVSLGRRVALKVLPRHSLLDPRSLERFRREARAVARLHHTNIVQVFGTGEQEELHYFVMQYIAGVGLDDIRRELKQRQQIQSSPVPPPNKRSAPLADIVAGLVAGRFAAGPSAKDRGSNTPSGLPPMTTRTAGPAVPGSVPPHPDPDSAEASPTPAGRAYWVSVARIGIQVADALAFAHAQGIVHRDIKPSNLLLDQQGRAWVTDFGLAKETADPEDLTRSDLVVGTLRYVPPERFQGRSDARGDVYGLGMALYELLVLRPAFVEHDRNKLLEQVMHGEPPRPRRLNPAVPYDLETVVLKAINRDPAQRYQNAADLAEDLRRFVDERPVRARRVSAVERLWLWCRRDPRTALLSGALLLVFLLVFAGVTLGWLWAEDKANREAMALAEAEWAKGEAHANLYFSQISQARLEWRLNNVAGAEGLLKQCEPDRRSWEWNYLDGLLHSDLLTLHHPSLNWISGVDFSRDGRLLAFTGSDPYRSSVDHPVVLWDVQKGEQVRTLAGPEQGLRVRFSPNGKLLVVSGMDGTVQLWDVESGAQRHSWPRGFSAAFSPDSKQLALGSREAITFWDTESLQQIRSLPSNGGRITLSPDGRLLAVTAPAEVEIRDATTGQGVSRLPYGRGGPGGNLDVYSMDGPEVAFSPDSKQLVVATSPPRIWDVSTGNLLNNLGGHSGVVPGVAFSPDGRQVATAGADSTVRLWDAQSGAELMVLRGHSAWAACVSFHPEGSCLVSGGRQPGEVKFWDLTRQPEYLTLNDSNAQALGFRPDNQRLNLVTIRGRLQSREPAGGKITQGARLDLVDLRDGRHWVTPANIAAFSMDGRRVAGVSGDGRAVKVWEVESGRELASLAGLTKRIVHVAISADGRRVAAVDWPGKQSGLPRRVEVWDADTGQLLAQFEAIVGPHFYVHGAVALSPDGTRLAYDDYTPQGTQDGAPRLETRVRVHDLVRQQEVFSVSAGDHVVLSLAFSADGRCLAAGEREGPIFVWDRTGRSLSEAFLEGDAYRVAFHPDGERLAAVNREQVKVWDVRAGKEILTLRGAPPRPTDGGFNPVLAWSGNGRWLAALSWNGSVSVWDTAERETPAAAKTLRQVPAERVYEWHLNEAELALNAHQPAGAKLHLDQVRDVEPPDLVARQRRAHLFVRSGEWGRAAADFAQVFAALEPEEPWPWVDYARALVLKGDQEGYRRLCVRFVGSAEAGRHDYMKPGMAWACVLAPGAVDDPAATIRLGEAGRAYDPTEPGPLLALGLAHFRAGEWERTLTRLQELCDTHPESASLAWPVLAMAHQRLGHAEEARRWLERAKVRHEEITQALTEAPRGLSLDASWPQFEIEYAEVLALVTLGKP
jgi:WD40 repeat protein/serine/threonine protein kinase